jgi:hypothetical protein
MLVEIRDLAVYVPSPSVVLTTLAHIPRGAGIVGSPDHDHIRIDFAIPAASRGRPPTWASLVACAAHTHERRHASANRSWVLEGDVVAVGVLNAGRVVPHPWRLRDIQEWVENYSPTELEVRP